MKRPLVALTGLLLARALAQVDLALSPARLELVLPPGDRSQKWSGCGTAWTGRKPSA